MLTIQEIRLKGTWYQPYPRNILPGCFLLPPIKLRCISSELLPDIVKGEIVTVEAVDINGRNPGTIKLAEKSGWCPPEHFELVTQTPIS